MAHGVCPWWLGYLLLNPLRRLTQSPERILGPYLRPGMMAVDFGCGMGFFSLPMARMVGPSGRVLCIDLQERMLAGLSRRAVKAGLAGTIEALLASPGDTHLAALAGRIDFILAMFVIHETPDPERLLRECAAALKPDGRLLAAEPVLHVRRQAFDATVATAERCGLQSVDRPRIWKARAVLMRAAVTPRASAQRA